MSERAVEKHVGSVFQKLGLVHESEVNRRVMAVLAFLEATGGADRPRDARRRQPAAGRAASTLPGRRLGSGTMAVRRCRMTEVRVLVVDDQEPFRRAMAAVVDETDGFVVVGVGRRPARSRSLRRRRAAPRPGADGRQPARHRRHRGRPPARPRVPTARSWSCSRPTTRTSSTWPGAAPRRTSPRRRSGRTGSQRRGPAAGGRRAGPDSRPGSRAPGRGPSRDQRPADGLDPVEDRPATSSVARRRRRRRRAATSGRARRSRGRSRSGRETRAPGRRRSRSRPPPRPGRRTACRRRPGRR